MNVEAPTTTFGERVRELLVSFTQNTMLGVSEGLPILVSLTVLCHGLGSMRKITFHPFDYLVRQTTSLTQAAVLGFHTPLEARDTNMQTDPSLSSSFVGDTQVRCACSACATLIQSSISLNC